MTISFGTFPYRSECRCVCHSSPGIIHFAQCCIPNPIIPSDPMRNAVNKTSELDADRLLKGTLFSLIKAGLVTNMQYGGVMVSPGKHAKISVEIYDPFPHTAPEPTWDVQEFKLWKGIDASKPVWGSRGFCCSTWAAANELMEYLQHNCPELLFRVAPNRHSSSATPAPEPQPEVAAEPVADVIEWLETELSAIDCRYRGSPTYDHDAYWMKDRVRTLLRDAKAAFALATPPVVEEAVKAERHQDRVAAWMLECFTQEISEDKVERTDRFVEEALELAQATGWSADRAHALVDYVFGRLVGEIGQEVGGVMVTLAALCNTFDVDLEAEAKREVDRITRPEIILKIRAKQAAKPTGSALPSALSQQAPE